LTISGLANKTLNEIRLRQRFGVKVLALHFPHAAKAHGHFGFELNPGPDTMLHAGDVLIVVGNAQRIGAGA